MPSKLVTKFRDHGLNSALCDWILNFLPSAEWMAASQPGNAAAPPSAIRLCRGWWKLLNTSPGRGCHLWRTSTPRGVGEGHQNHWGPQSLRRRLFCAAIWPMVLQHSSQNHQAQGSFILQANNTEELCPYTVISDFWEQ